MKQTVGSRLSLLTRALLLCMATACTLGPVDPNDGTLPGESLEDPDGNSSDLTAAQVGRLPFDIPAKIPFALPTGTTLTVATDNSGNYKTDGTDDQVEINKALSKIKSLGGGTVHLKAGTYKITKPISIFGNTILEGESGTTVTLSSKANIKNDFFNRNALIQHAGSTKESNIVIRGFTIDGNADAFHPDDFPANRNVHVPADVEWALNHGIAPRGATCGILLRFDSIKNIAVVNMVFQHGLGDAVFLYQSSGLTFMNNIASDLGHDGLFLKDSTNATVTNNEIFTRVDAFVRFWGASNVKIFNNVIHSRPSEKKFQSTGPGIVIADNGKSICKDSEITNNVFHTLDGSGIWGPGSGSGTGLKIHNNLIYNTGRYRTQNNYSNSGITLSGYSAEIYNNVIDDAGRWGILLTGQASSTVHHNILMNTGATTRYAKPGAALSGSGAKNVLVSKNNCFSKNNAQYEGTVASKSGDMTLSSQPKIVHDSTLSLSPKCNGSMGVVGLDSALNK